MIDPEETIIGDAFYITTFFPVTNNNTVSLVLWNYFSETRFKSTKFCNQKVKDQSNKMFIVLLRSSV